MQGDREPCKSFVVSLSTLIRRRGGYSEEDKLERIYNNLKPGYKLYIRRSEVKTLPELLSRAEEYESILRERTTYRTSPVTHPPVYQTQPRRSTRVQFEDRAYLEELAHEGTSLNPPHSPSQVGKNSLRQEQDRTRTRPPPERSPESQEEREKTQPRYSPPTLRNSPVFCWNCDREGHMARQCHQPRRVRCFFCKKDGHLTVSCRYRPGNESPTLRKGSL